MFSIIKKILKNIFSLFFSVLFLPIYHAIGLIPRNKNIWIFSSWFGKKYSDNTKYLFEYLNKKDTSINSIWITKNKKVLKELKEKKYRVVYAYSLKCFFYTIRASKLFTTSGEELPLHLCNGIEYYALWHGMPLKKILLDDKFSRGISIQGKIKNYLLKILRTIFPWRDFITQKNMYTITNSEFFIPYLSTAFNLPKERILTSGSPRCDTFFNSQEETIISDLRKKYENCKIILYMPTFRTSSWTGQVFLPFTEKFKFDKEKFQNVIEKYNYCFIYKPHFSDAQYMNASYNKNQDSRFISVSDLDFSDLYNFVAQVDILVTDYSSIYFDFLIMSKPVILTPFDLEEYTSTSRDFYFDYHKNMEGIKASDWESFLDIISKNKFYVVSENTKKKFASFLDGNCSSKLTKEILK